MSDQKPPNRSPGLISLMGEYYQTYKEILIPILLKLFQKIEEKGTLSNSFHKTTITLIRKPDKDITKKKLIGHEHRGKTS